MAVTRKKARTQTQSRKGRPVVALSVGDRAFLGAVRKQNGPRVANKELAGIQSRNLSSLSAADRQFLNEVLKQRGSIAHKGELSRVLRVNAAQKQGTHHSTTAPKSRARRRRAA